MLKKDSSKRSIQFLLGLSKVAPYLSALMIATQITNIVFSSTIAPIFVSRLLTRVADGTAILSESLSLLGLYATSLIVSSVIMSRITIALAFIVQTRMQSSISLRVFNHLTAKSLGFHSEKMSGGIISDANKLFGTIESFWDTIVFNIIPIVTTIVSISVALSFIMWQYAITLGILSIAIVAVIIKFQLAITPVSQDVAKKSSAMTGYFSDVITNMSAVKAFAKEKNESDKFEKLVVDWKKANLKEMGSVLKITSVISVMMTVMNVTAFIVAIFATEYQIANVGSIYLVMNYTLRVVGEIWSVGSATRSYIRIIGDSGPMIAILDDKIEIPDPTNPINFLVNRGEIIFDDISFTHKNNAKPLFKNFTLRIKPGERVGLVGTSGSGKTSLTKLLLRFNNVDKGQILIDKQNIAMVTQQSLRESIAYVPQEALLFHRSIRENIAYGNPTASEQEILYAAKQANALDFIETLPGGMDTTVGERGVKLSGGQRQRIVIARAILKNAPILVLDEATSALDSENESLIQDALWELMKNRTSIVIAHRLSTIAKLDRIIVIQDGKIIEEGSHNDLLAINGTYSRLWQHQSGGFIKT